MFLEDVEAQAIEINPVELRLRLWREIASIRLLPGWLAGAIGFCASLKRAIGAAEQCSGGLLLSHEASLVGELPKRGDTASDVSSRAGYPTKMNARAGVLDLARRDGWLAVYDVTNASSRTVVGGSVSELRDGLANLPPLAPRTARIPRLAPGAHGALDALLVGTDGATIMTTGSLEQSVEQPSFVLAVVRSADDGPDSTRIVIDGLVRERNAILVSARGAWSLYGGHQADGWSRRVDDEVHVVGAAFDGTQSALWVDDHREPLRHLKIPPFTQALGGLTVGGRYATEHHAWIGSVGPILLYDGIPAQAVRRRMTRLLLDLIAPTGIHIPDPISAAAALSTNRMGGASYEKNPDLLTLPASTLKLLAAYTARQKIRDDLLEETVTASPSDNLRGIATPQLEPGDTITYRDLFYLMMMPSHNAAARIVARTVGERLPGTADPGEKFLQAMRSLAATWGWEGSIIADPAGIATSSRLSARMMVELLYRVADEDPFLLAAMSAVTREIVIMGLNPRVEVATHSVNRDKLPEIVAGKTGTLNRIGAGLAFLSHDGDGSLRATAFLQSYPVSERNADARRILDRVAERSRSPSADTP